jgi:hypothetical protein
MPAPQCETFIALVKASVYFILAIAFLVRTLITNKLVDPKYFIYFASYLHTSDTSTTWVVREHPGIICILASVTYAILSLLRSPDGMVQIVCDGIIVALLQCVLVGIMNVLQMFNMVGIYTAFHILVFWITLNRTYDMERLTMFKVALVILMTCFWVTVFGMMVVNWVDMGVEQGFASCVFILDCFVIKYALKHKREGEEYPRNLALETWVRDATRITLLICVFVDTLNSQ